MKSQELTGGPERNYGIDLMRIVSMLMVLTLHVLGQGGVLGSTRLFTVKNQLAWLMEVGAYGAVDCFALISGYAGYKTRHKGSSLLHMCLQILFYTLGITTLFLIYAPELATLEDLWKSTVPFAYNYYWYFTGYMGLFFFMPALDLVVDKLPEQQAKKLVAAIVVLFSVIPALFNSDVFRTYSGYSMVWLGMMYLIGAFVRKYEVGKKWKNWVFLMIYFACTLIAWGSRQGSEWLCHHLTGEAKRYSGLVSYTSPAMVIGSVALLIWFSRLKIRGVFTKIIGFFAPLAFNVYIIHLHPLLWKNVMKGCFKSFAAYPSVQMMLAVLGAVAGIFLVCVFIDAGRKSLFELLHVKTGCEKFIQLISRPFRRKDKVMQ